MLFDRASETDLKHVFSWLKQEEIDDRPGNFYCNRNVIQSAQEEGKLIVARRSADELPLAFCAIANGSIDILAVQFEHRRSGIGTALANKVIELFRLNKTCRIDIDCKPATSIPFWRAQNFHVDETGKGYFLLNYSNIFKEEKLNASVLVTTYPYKVKWETDTQPLETINLRAKLENDIVILENTVCLSTFDLTDVIIKIEVDGSQVYFDKIKYSESQAKSDDGYNRYFDQFILSKYQKL